MEERFSAEETFAAGRRGAGFARGGFLTGEPLSRMASEAPRPAGGCRFALGV